MRRSIENGFSPEAKKRIGSLIVYHLDSKNFQIYDLSEDFVQELLEFKNKEVLTEEEAKELINIDQEAFPELYQAEYSFPAQNLRELIEKKNLKGVSIIFKRKGKAVGYLTSYPKNNTLYIESIAGNFWGLKMQTILDVFSVFEREALKRGFRKIAFHGYNEKLANFLEKELGFSIIRREKEWLGKRNVPYYEKELKP